MPLGGKFSAVINSFCVQLMKFVSKGFGALTCKVLKQRKGRAHVPSLLFALFFFSASRGEDEGIYILRQLKKNLGEEMHTLI